MGNQYDDLIKEAENIINEDNASSKQQLLDEAEQIVNEAMKNDFSALEQLDAEFSKSTEIIKNRMGKVFVLQLNTILEDLKNLKQLAAYMDALGITKEDMAKYGTDVQGVFSRVKRADLKPSEMEEFNKKGIDKQFSSQSLEPAPEPENIETEELELEDPLPEDYDDLDKPEENHKHR